MPPQKQKKNSIEVLLPLLLIFIDIVAASHTEVAVLNITRLEDGDTFFITGGECGVTRCTEISGGTALSDRPPGAAPPCSCRCPRNLPMFREDLIHCVSDITECPLVEFGSGSSSSRVPYVFIPLSGQIVHPSKEINFEDSESAVCAVSGAQFLTRTGWSSLKNDVDNDVPFSLYRDEGNMFLQWRGTEGTRARATGRVILARLSCRVGTRMFSPCVGFRAPGSPPDLNHDMSEVWFSHGEISAEKHAESSQMNIMGGAAGVSIVFCTFVALILYGTLLVFHLRNKNKRPLLIDVENPPFKDDTMPNTKTNPLMSIETFLKEAQGTTFDGLNNKSDSISNTSSEEQSSDSLSKSKESDIKCIRTHRTKKIIPVEAVFSTNVMVHKPKEQFEKKTESCSQMCGNVEKIPESHVAIVETPEGYVSKLETSGNEHCPSVIGSQRKKLYFNPSFFEIQYLKSPPPAAIEFLTKIREVISLAKEKMLSKRFIPMLLPIPEESYQAMELDISFPYETLSQHHTTHSLKRENSRRKNDCTGCPGCTDMKFKKKYMKTLSEKEFCKTCVTNEFKQDIVRKWLEEVPVITDYNNDSMKSHRKSVTKVEGTPTPIKPIVQIPKPIPDILKISNRFPDKISINVPCEPPLRRKKMPPPPPPPQKRVENSSENINNGKKKDDDDRIMIPPELKQKMNAVINELSKFRKIEPIQPRATSPVTEVVTPFIPNSVIAVTPRLVIPTPPRFAKKVKPKIMSFREDQHQINNREFVNFDIDSLERSTAKRRASLSNIDNNWLKVLESDKNHKRRSSIIAMEELEPMKKIYEMNSRLSRSFQELSATSLAWNDELLSLQDVEKYAHKPAMNKPNLVSEVYINDYANVNLSNNESDHSNTSTSLKVKYKEPFTKPGQLVIEVEGPPKKMKYPDYEDFDPDTLDRKPGKLKLHKDIPLSPPISPNKTIDRMFNRSKIEENDQIDTQKLKIGSLLEIFEAKNKQNRNSLEQIHTSKDSDVTKVIIDDYRPPLPPKRITSEISNDLWENQSTFRVSDRIQKSPSKDISNPPIKFRITRSEPYNNKNDVSNRPSNHEKKKFTTFGNMDMDSNNCNFHSLDTTYENIDEKYYKGDKVTTRNYNNFKRPGRRSTKQRFKRMEQNHLSKTEDSGYLSSDSNESRHKGKFILQVRDKNDTLKEMISDTDDLDSAEDARSESGGESIETNSVFFGSYRRLSVANGQNVIDTGYEPYKIDNDNKHSKRNRSVSAFKEKYLSMDNL